MQRIRHSLAGLMVLILVPVLPASAKTLRPPEVKARYRQILSVVAEGERQKALAELIEFETSFVGEQRAWRYIDNIWRMKLAVIRELLKVQPVELLQPIVLLHHDAYFRYAEMERRYLAGHSRQMASELAEVYVERTDSTEARVFGGWVLTSLGAYLWSPTSVSDSATLFYRAYLMDPGNEMALLGLSAAYEKKGEYAKAIEYLQKAVQMDPSNVEAELRLALCEIRSQPEVSASVLERLSALAQESDPAWIRSIAYQEIARAELDRGELRAAEETLRQGLAALSGDQHLHLQLAALLERQGRRGEALDLIEAVTPDSGVRDSPRERYDFWEPAGVDDARIAHLGERPASLSALSAGLSESPKEGR